MAQPEGQPAVQVVLDERAHRYEARLVGAVVGAAYYDTVDDLIAFTHTEVDKAVGGRGVGSALVQAALDDVRRKGQRVIPRCSFVRTWIDRHPDYQDLLD